MNERDVCPDAETLAQFAEGELAGRARGELVTHVQACPDCYEVYVDTLHLLEETSPAGSVLHGRVDAARQRPSKAWVLGALAAAAAIFFWVARRPPAPAPAAPDTSLWALTEATAAIVPAPTAALGLWPAQAGSGQGFTPEDGGRSLMRVGVRIADLELAAGSTVASQDEALQALRAELETSAQPEWRVTLRHLDEEHASGRIPAAHDLVPAAGLVRDAVAAGRLIELCRHAANARNAAFFEAAPTRAALRALPAALRDPAARAQVEHLTASLQALPSDAAGWHGFENLWRELLEVLT